jgi:Fe-S cluster assembly protein SufD
LLIKKITVAKDTKIVCPFILKGNDSLDLNLLLLHEKPNTKSEVLVKGIVRDSAQTKITVNLKINKTAKNVETFFKCQILNLGATSKAEVFPYLEIHQNQLRAGHAVSIRKIREEEMFYMKSRGLDEKQCEKLIIEGFFDNLGNGVKINGINVS